MSSPAPVLIPAVFAVDGDRNVIPLTSADPQRAQYEEGFPVLTMTPVAEGGKPPLGPDFNGIFYAAFSHLFALQGGALQAFSTGVSDAIGGYNKGAIVAMANGEGYWICIVDDTTDNPDSGFSAGWRPIYAYGPGAISGLTGGTRTLSVVEASRPFLVLTGTLTSNLQLVVPTVYQQWLVINATTGAFTVTVKTGAGTGVVVPTGGAAAPTAVYCDGTNVQRVFTPSALPTSVSPVADTIMLRDNLGFGFSVTPAAGDSTTKIATTAFVNRAVTLAANGSQVLPSGLILKWGFTSFSDPVKTITFPVAFPTACYNVQLTPLSAGASLRDKTPVVGSISAASFTMQDSDGSLGSYWSALGA